MSQNDPLSLQKETTFRTQSGIPLYLYPNPHLHSFCLCLYAKGGSLYEGEGENGVTHAIEHLLFRNVNHAMKGEMYATLDRLGLCFEGTTYKEFVQFSITGPTESFAAAAEIFTRLLLPLSLPAKEWEVEKRRIKAEIREEGERTSLDFFADGIVHGGTSLSRTITGTAGGLDAFSLSFLEKARRSLFSLGNFFFYLTGNATESDAALLCRLAEDYEIEKDAPVRNNLAPLPPAFGRRNATVAVKNKTRTSVRLSVDVDTSLTTDAELILLYDILFGDGECCLLHRALSEEKGYIYSFRAGMELYRNMAVISVSYEIPPKSLLPSLRLLTDALGRVKKEVGDALEGVRAPYVLNAEMMLDDAADLNWNRAYETKILGLPYETVADRKTAYARVTEGDVCALARSLFTPQNLTLTVCGNARRIDKDALRATLLSLEE
ncbi:MAG: insulinase family protein [Clostridia bacterium]|nr:insulinase family protein [Clostridia bacterium]